MPGLFGIISKVADDKFRDNLELMQDSMLHESFYSTGIYHNEQVGLYAGWTCHEGSFCDCMPIVNETKDKVMLFFGEDYTELETLRKLRGKNHIFNKSNASYLIHMFEEDENETLLQLNGWFNGLIIDTKEKKILLFNDRYGMQRIYYYEDKYAFYFSAEAKSLLKVCPELRQIDMRGLGELICCNTVLNQRSLYENVFLLPAASKWIFKNGQKTQEQYHHPRLLENQPLLEKEFYYNKLQEVLVKILPRYFRSEQSIGISLTGGLDTRIIMSYLQNKAGKYPCYTFGSIYRDCNDVKVAKKVAEACNQKHQSIELGNEFLYDFAKYAEKTIYVSDGYLDISGSPEIYVNNIARKIAPVRITGNHGSELFRNVRWLKAFYPHTSLCHPDFGRYIQNAMTTYSTLSAKHPITFTLFNESPWHEYNRLAIEQSQLTLRTPYHDNDLVDLVYRAPPEVRDNNIISLRLIADGNPVLRGIATDRGAGGKLIPPFSLVSRLYHEFYFKSEYFYNYGMPQWLANIDYMLKPLHIERIFLGRHKFYHFRVWYRDQLGKYVKEILLDNLTLNRPYWNKKFIKKMVHSHTKGYRNYTNEITKVLSIELIERLLV
jgi:asparagine synthase (glutamine-hydrolysing)